MMQKTPDTAKQQPNQSANQPASTNNTTYSKAYNKAIRLLAIREHSQAEIRTKLNAFPDEHIHQVLDALQQQDYQSDERFTEGTLRSRTTRGKGYLFIKQELKQHHIDPDLIEQCLESIDEEHWQSLCYQAWHKKFNPTRNNLHPASPQEIAQETSSEAELWEDEDNATEQLSYEEKIKQRAKQQNFLSQRGFRPQDWKHFL